ncbi:hypothetical protein PZA11_001390 [Diplocarpon coronariae]
MTDLERKSPPVPPPWAKMSALNNYLNGAECDFHHSIIGIAGSSGSGKSTLSHAIVSKLNLPWDSFYKTLDEESSVKAFRNEYDFDSPDAIDFDVLVDRLRDLKAGKKAEIPIYSFAKHAREAETSTIYSPHVLVLEGIFALYDPRVLELLDMKVGITPPLSEHPLAPRDVHFPFQKPISETNQH